MARKKPRPRQINLALQGGGSHGAFTWGVLDALLEDGRYGFEGISGTSAGAINGAVLVCGLAKDGPEGARQLLEDLWLEISRQSAFGPFQVDWLGRLSGSPNLDSSPAYVAFDLMMRVASPYQFNPLNWNPLRDVLTKLVDIDCLTQCQQPRLYVSATNVAKGRLRVFAGPDISIDALLASACLPFLFQAVEIEGEHYWDGGYMGNPTLYPLIHACEARDVLVVQVNPIERDGVPRTGTAIMNRVNEVSFNATFMREARALGLINRLLEENQLQSGQVGLRPMYLHMIGKEAEMGHFGASSKLNGDLGFLRELFGLGRAAAIEWLAEDAEHVGHRSSFEVGSLQA